MPQYRAKVNRPEPEGNRLLKLGWKFCIMLTGRQVVGLNQGNDKKGEAERLNK